MSGWIKFYASDWLAGTSGLTASERGVYITLVCLVYENEGPVKMDAKRLARRCGVTKPAFMRALESLSEDPRKIVINGDSLTNPRAERELDLRNIRSQKASHSASQRWHGVEEKTQQKQHAENANASAKQCENDANQIPEPDIEKREAKASPKKKRGSRLAEDWVLPMDWGEWALSSGWAEATVRIEAEKFRDFWISKPGKDGIKLDWLATWRNWMRNSKSPKAINGETYGRPARKSDERANAFITGARGTP